MKMSKTTQKTIAIFKYTIEMVMEIFNNCFSKMKTIRGYTIVKKLPWKGIEGNKILAEKLSEYLQGEGVIQYSKDSVQVKSPDYHVSIVCRDNFTEIYEEEGTIRDDHFENIYNIVSAG